MKLDTIRKALCEELDRYAERGGDMSERDLDAIHKLTASIKNIDKIEMFDSYSRDSSYDREYSGAHYVRGHYSRDYGKGGSNRLEDRIEDMMRDARTEKEREALRKCMNQLCG